MRRSKVLHLHAVLWALGVLFASAQALAAPKAVLLPFWDASNPSSTSRIDHQPWAAFLQTYARAHPSGINRVAYAQVSAEDTKALDRYLEALQALPIRTYSRDEQFAYWVNLYNALTVRLILEHYPVESITDISFGFLTFGPWEEELVEVEGQPLSLNAIEHGILRPLWRDERIHYVVNCASLGCPNLGLTPFRAQAIDAQLDAAANDFILHPRGVSLTGNTLRLSKIYQWYASDFGVNEDAVAENIVAHIVARLAADPQDNPQALAGYQQWLRLPKNQRQIAYDYDWSLNHP